MYTVVNSNKKCDSSRQFDKGPGCKEKEVPHCYIIFTVSLLFVLTAQLYAYERGIFIQQISFKPMSSNLETQIIWHLRVVPRPEVLLFIRKKLHWGTRHISGTCPKRPPRVFMHQPMWYFLTPCLLVHQLFQLWTIYITQNWTLMTLKQQMKEICKQNIPVFSCTAQIQG